MLAADAPLSVILQSAAQMMQTPNISGSSLITPQLQGQVLAATAALADMLDAAAAGRSLPRAAIDSSVESMNRAAETADLESWLAVVLNHDDLTYQHCLLVAGLAATFAHRLHFSESDRQRMTCAAVLHDIGKAKIPREILAKPGALDEAERELIRTHPVLGAQMLQRQGGFGDDIIAVARSHHEYLDGSGYPDGLKGAQISDLVRMITICDIFAALIERRSYKPPMAPQAAYTILQGMHGKLDGDLLRAFKELLPAEPALAVRRAWPDGFRRCCAGGGRTRPFATRGPSRSCRRCVGARMMKASAASGGQISRAVSSNSASQASKCRGSSGRIR